MVDSRIGAAEVWDKPSTLWVPENKDILKYNGGLLKGQEANMKEFLRPKVEPFEQQNK